MIRVPWDLEEAILLLDFYYSHGENANIPKKELEPLSLMLVRRADKLGIFHDEKFRNTNGLSIQLHAMDNVVANHSNGYGQASAIFFDAYDMYKNNPVQFRQYCQSFIDKYGIN